MRAWRREERAVPEGVGWEKFGAADPRRGGGGGEKEEDKGRAGLSAESLRERGKEQKNETREEASRSEGARGRDRRPGARGPGARTPEVCWESGGGEGAAERVVWAPERRMTGVVCGLWTGG